MAIRHNKKQYKKFRKDLNNLGKMKIQIGAVGKHKNADISNAALLRIHEVGVPSQGIPARAPIRKTFRNKKNLRLIGANIQGLIRNNYKNGELQIEKITDGLGLTMKNLVQATIKRRLDPANKPDTVRRKRGDLPLVDTGQMVNSIEYGVNKK